MNPFKQRLAAEEPVLGMLVTMPSPHLVQTVAAAGLDWVMIDMEHGPIDLGALHGLVAATAGTACAPLVRVPMDNLELAKPVLDAGAFGIVFPMVCTAEDARRVVRLMRYPPAGERGVGAIYAPQRWGLSMPEYMARADEELATCVLIEHIEAVRNLEAILAVPGIDMAAIAPFDLSASLGRPGDLEHPEVRAAIEQAERGILAGPTALGGLALSAEDARAKLERGYRVLILGYDVYLVQQALGSLLSGIRG